MTDETLPKTADPLPWICYGCGGRYAEDEKGWRGHRTVWAPRPEFDALTLQRRMFENSVDAGWDPELVNTFAEEIAHLHEEVSEAFREWRLHKNFETRHDPETGKPLGIPAEFADVLIGMFYLAELNGFDLLAAMEEKAAWNVTRDYVAEGRQLHASKPSDSDGKTHDWSGEGD